MRFSFSPLAGRRLRDEARSHSTALGHEPGEFRSTPWRKAATNCSRCGAILAVDYRRRTWEGRAAVTRCPNHMRWVRLRVVDSRRRA